MKLRAEAKLNLTLEVGARRADGYHDVDTVMHSISLCDVVTLGVLDSIEVTCAGLDCDAQDNIAYKAARAFFARAGLSGGARIDIAKGIPVGAGLGGGSADAAAVLRRLNALYGRPLDASALLELAAGVGADVPFCLLGGAARCRGIGERVEPLPSAGGLYGGDVPPSGRVRRRKAAARPRIRRARRRRGRPAGAGRRAVQRFRRARPLGADRAAV